MHANIVKDEVIWDRKYGTIIIRYGRPEGPDKPKLQRKENNKNNNEKKRHIIATYSIDK